MFMKRECLSSVRMYPCVLVSSVRVEQACLFTKFFCAGRASCIDQAFVLMKVVRLLVCVCARVCVCVRLCVCQALVLI